MTRLPNITYNDRVSKLRRVNLPVPSLSADQEDSALSYFVRTLHHAGGRIQLSSRVVFACKLS
jgi:hypothetical protein